MLDVNYYKEFLNISQDPVWIVDSNYRFMYTNNAYKKFYSMEKENIVNKSIDEIIKGSKIEIFKKNIDKALKEKKSINYEAYMKEKFFECRLTPIVDSENKVKYVGGIIIDMTARYDREGRIINKKNILQSVIDTIPDVIFLKNKEGKYQLINKACREYYKNLGLKEVIGKTDLEINPDKKLAKIFMNQDRKILEDGISTYGEPEMKNLDGSITIKSAVKSPLLDSEDNIIGIVGISRDITKQKKIEEELKYLSYIDILTGVHNRSCFEDKIRKSLKKEDLPIGVIMGDVNGLKLINDTFGHLEGDKLLVSMANVLKKVCGEYAHIFRWGGDEFVILVPKAEQESCDKIIELIKEECTRYEDELIELSMSMGSAILKNEEDSIYSTLKEAEETVYKHKLLEKNSIVSSAINSLQESLEAKSLETKEHTQRMIELALTVGKKIGLRISELDELEIATKLHDIGKIGVREEILMKPSNLTDIEFQIIKTHSEKGYRIVKASNALESIARAVLTHHEKWDGSGYPLGLKGEEIPLLARIISVVDSYDAMTNDRVYKKGISKEEALEEIRRCGGKHFDPNITDIFIKIMDEL